MSKLDLTIKTDGPDRPVTFQVSYPVVVGRQSRGDEPLGTPCALSPDAKAELERGGVPLEATTRRLAVAALRLASISRFHLLVVPVDDGRFKIGNLSREHPIFMERSHRELKQREIVTLTSEEILWLGEKTDGAGAVLQPRQPIIRLIVRQTPDDDVDSLAVETRPPGLAFAKPAPPPLSTPSSVPREREEFLEWFDKNMDAFQGAAKPEELFSRAAQAVVDMVKLDAGQVLRRDADGAWSVAVSYAPPGSAPARKHSETVLAKMVNDKKTVFVSAASMSGARSVMGLEVVAAAPIRDRSGAVIGAIYGEVNKQQISRPIRNEEALMLQLIARAVAAALDRLEPEKEAGRDLTRLTMYMSDDQARAVITQPDWRKGKQTNVSVLHCDIVGSTDILNDGTTPLGKATGWSAEVLEMLTGCVRKSGGTLIDYTGDGLFALWGAPIGMTDHEEKAVSAALAMANGLEQINARWEGEVNRKTELRLGLNCGPVMVGNVGTREFEKFGAYGVDVNLGKRIETAGKDLQAHVLLHDSLGRRLRPSGQFAIRRLRTIHVKGASQPFHVYELCPDYVADRGTWDADLRSDWQSKYEEALGLIESCQEDKVRKAAGILGRWRESNRWDRPALVLLAHAIKALADRTPEAFASLRVLDLRK